MSARPEIPPEDAVTVEIDGRPSAEGEPQHAAAGSGQRLVHPSRSGREEDRDPQGGYEKEGREKSGQEALARISMRRCARSVVVILRS